VSAACPEDAARIPTIMTVKHNIRFRFDTS